MMSLKTAFIKFGQELTKLVEDKNSTEREIQSGAYETRTVTIKDGTTLSYYLNSHASFDGRALRLIVEGPEMELNVLANEFHCSAHWMNCSFIPLGPCEWDDANILIERFNAGEALTEILADRKINNALFAHVIGLEEKFMMKAPSISTAQKFEM